MDPHLYYADPDPAVFLNADPGPGPALKEKNHEEFSEVVKNIKDCSKVRNDGACANLLIKNLIKLQFLAFYLHFFSF